MKKKKIITIFLDKKKADENFNFVLICLKNNCQIKFKIMSKKTIILIFVFCFIVSSISGAFFGFLGGIFFNKTASPFIEKTLEKIGIEIPEVLNNGKENKEVKVVETKQEESAVISAVEKTSPAVVSIIISKDLPKVERYFIDPFSDDFFSDFFSPFGSGLQIPQYRQNGTEKQEIGGGTGFAISPDGLILTNRHVVSDQDAEYTVLTNDEEKYPAEVLARDLINDVAILKIEAENLPSLEFGDSDSLKIGQTVIAIGNALGEFRNTVSRGVISGLRRSITAGGYGEVEQLSGMIQTDAAINQGNSGGPLIDLDGKAIGVNVAMAYGAENIGFAIAVNDLKNIVKDVKEQGKIIRPFLGVRYVLINEKIKEKNNLSYDYGALILRGENPEDLAIIPGSPADKAGLVENDIILEINGEKVGEKNTLSKLISKCKVGDEAALKILHRGEEKEVKVRLEERK